MAFIFPFAEFGGIKFYEPVRKGQAQISDRKFSRKRTAYQSLNSIFNVAVFLSYTMHMVTSGLHPLLIQLQFFAEKYRA